MWGAKFQWGSIYFDPLLKYTLGSPYFFSSGGGGVWFWGVHFCHDVPIDVLETKAVSALCKAQNGISVDDNYLSLSFILELLPMFYDVFVLRRYQPPRLALEVLSLIATGRAPSSVM